MVTSKVSSQWPKPTTPEPSLRQLAEWLLSGTSRATDGCVVKPEGVGPHGHPSWLLRKEMVCGTDLLPNTEESQKRNIRNG